MEVLKEYYVGAAKIQIVKDEKKICKYIIEEPQLNETEKKVLDEVLSSILYTTEKNLDDEIIKNLKEKGVNDESIERVLYHVKKQMLYGDITPLMLDNEVEEVECRGYNSPISIVHRSAGDCIRLQTNIIPENDDQVIKIIERLATRANKSVNIAKPMLEFALPEGHRVAATVSNEISLPGSTFDIRKFPAKPLSITSIIQREAINEMVAAYLWFLMEYKPFIMILGHTGAGKTTLLNALLNMVNPSYKILTIEDTPEINIVNDNWVRFISRSTLEGHFDITLNDLAKLSLRYRPDYLVIGEVRGKEIEALVHASASGHSSLTTFHGSKPLDAVTRITSLLSTESPELGKLFLQTIWAFVVSGSRKEGNANKRGVLAIYETVPKGNDVEYIRVIEWDFANRTFKPADFDTIINNSYRLNLIGDTYGLSKDDIKADLERRARFLRKLINDNVIDFLDVGIELRKFYSGEVVLENEKAQY